MFTQSINLYTVDVCIEHSETSFYLRSHSWNGNLKQWWYEKDTFKTEMCIVMITVVWLSAIFT